MANKVYVIDDDTALRTAYAAALSKLGHEVSTATDGLEGLELMKKGKPDIILVDMLMPNLDGIGFLKELRGDEGNKDVKVVIASNFEPQDEAKDLGVSKYVSKLSTPPDGVADAVDAVLKS